MSSLRTSPQSRRPRSATSVEELSASPALTQQAAATLSAVCPVVVPSPYAKQAEERSFAWLTRFYLLDSPTAVAKVKKTRCGLLSALVYPRASLELTSLGADFFAWLFLFDDKYGEGGESGEGEELSRFAPSLTELFRSGHCAVEEPFHAALLDIRARAAHLGEQWLARMAADLMLYLRGCLLELPFRRSCFAPSFREYLKIRLFSSAMFSVFDLIELDLSNVLDHSFIRRKEILELRVLASLAVCWDNDIISYYKEKKDGATLNLVTVIQKEKNITLNESFTLSSNIFIREIKRFIELKNYLIQHTEISYDEERYLQGLLDWVYGNRAWGALTLRYS